MPQRRKRRRWLWICVPFAVVILAGSAGDIALNAGHGGCGPDAPRGFSYLYRIPGPSMMPGLRPGDAVAAQPDYFCRHDPVRGDLAIFLPPTDDKTIYVERIVGLPGDRVQLVGGQLYINDLPVRREWVESAMHTDANGDPRHETEFIEIPPAGRPYHVLIGDENAPLQNTETTVVPPDHYFVLGDNRDNSMDSRTATPVGLVPRAAIADRPTVIFWSRDWSRIGRSAE